MAGHYLVLLLVTLVSSVYACRKSSEEAKKETEMKENLHRIRREAGLQNLVYKTPWYPLEQDGNIAKSFPMTVWDNVDSWKSFIQIKRRRKRGDFDHTLGDKSRYNVQNKGRWIEWRRRQHSTFMKEYWRYHRDENTSRYNQHKKYLVDFWARRKLDGITERQKKISEGLKRSWGRERKNGALRRIAFSKRMKNYWNQLNEAFRGPSRGEDHAELIKAHLKKLKLEGQTHCNETAELEKRYWNETNPEVWRKLGNRIEQYWKQQQLDGKPDVFRMLSEQKKEFWRILKEEGKTDMLKKMSDKKKEYWNRMNSTQRRRENLKFLRRISRWNQNKTNKGRITANEAMSKMKQDYWKRQKEEGGTKFEQFRKKMSNIRKEFWRKKKKQLANKVPDGNQTYLERFKEKMRKLHKDLWRKKKEERKREDELIKKMMQRRNNQTNI
uniref:Uncharacterized protein n=1 Tax=Cacopsylla melanoneura TaxID=428564 RepID=A0A8D8SYZ4_9HEMI